MVLTCSMQCNSNGGLTVAHESKNAERSKNGPAHNYTRSCCCIQVLRYKPYSGVWRDAQSDSVDCTPTSNCFWKYSVLPPGTPTI